MRVSPLAVALLIQAALWFWDLRLLPIWGDEQFTLNTAALGWSEIATVLERDIHPPLYYFAIKLWLSLWPASVEPIVAARAFSAACALVSTVALDRLWLRSQKPPVRWTFLALWTLSPCLLLYSRMARSYSLQLLLAVLAIEAAVRWLESKERASALRFAAAEALLLYTHYLPGLAIGAAAGLIGLRRAPKQAMLAGGVITAAYLPWVAVLWSSLGKAAEREAYSLTGNGWLETFLRIAFTGASFTVGEAVNTPLAAIAVVAAPAALGLAVWAGWKQANVRWMIVALAAAIGYLGAAQWVAYPFVPARLLFLLPFLLAGVAWTAGVRRPAGMAVAGVLLISAITGQTLYREQSGFLNKGYLVPYEQIAERIVAESEPETTLVLVDAFNGDPKPLRAVLPEGYELMEALDTDFPKRVRAAIGEASPSAIWQVGATRDVSPTAVRQQVDQILEMDYERADRIELLPYSRFDQVLLERLTGAQPPRSHFQAIRWTRVKTLVGR